LRSPEPPAAYRLYRDPESQPAGELTTGEIDFDRTLRELWDDRNTKPRGPNGGRTIRFGIDGQRRARKGRFAAQLNEGRARREREERRPLRDDHPVSSPFGDTIDFLRIVEADPPQRLLEVHAEGRELAININYAPLLRYHFLLIPEPAARTPQLLDERAIFDAFLLTRISRADNLFLGFNSRGSWASINHLHFQCVYYEDVDGASSERLLPVLRSPTEPVFDLPELRVERLAGYPLRGLILRGADQSRLGSAAFSFVAILQGRDIPHVVLIARDRIIVFPKTRSRGTLSPTGVGFFEASGEVFLGESETFEKVDERAIERELAVSSVSAAEFDALVAEWRGRGGAR
jgi:hypothetical protein